MMSDSLPEVSAKYLVYHAKHEALPRTACPKCQFEVVEGEDHECRQELAEHPGHLDREDS